MKTATLCLLATLSASVLVAQQGFPPPSMSIYPERPTTHDAIIVDIRLPWHDCVNPWAFATRQGYEITVTLRMSPHGFYCGDVPPIDGTAHVVIGALQASQYHLHVFNEDGQREIFSEWFEVAAAPVITSIEPRSGSAWEPTIVTIRGQSLYQDPVCTPDCASTVVMFGEKAVHIRAHSSDAIVVETQPQPDGIVDVRVKRADARVAVDRDAFLFGNRALDKWLIPVSVPSSPIGGALGSRWTTELAIKNDSGKPAIFVHPAFPSYLHRILPGETFSESPAPRIGSGGVFIYVDHAFADSLRRSLRVRDIAVDSGSVGVSIPIVTERETSNWQIDFIDIPTDPRYRINLRVYDFSGEHGAGFNVEAFRTAGEGRLIGSLSEATSRSEWADTKPPWPGYAEVDNLATRISGVQDEERVDIRVTVDPSSRWWAMLTITDNVTQQVTVVTPAAMESTN